MPTSIRIGQVIYTVTADEDDWLRIEHRTRIHGAYGHTENRRARIYLNPDQPESQMKLTLWHEVLHALFEAAMGRPTWKKLGPDREERVVRMLEAPTLNVLADNPELVAYLTS